MMYPKDTVMPPDYVLFIIIIIIIIIICWLFMYKELWLLMTQPKSLGRTDLTITLGVNDNE